MQASICKPTVPAFSGCGQAYDRDNRRGAFGSPSPNILRHRASRCQNRWPQRDAPASAAIVQIPKQESETTLGRGCRLGERRDSDRDSPGLVGPAFSPVSDSGRRGHQPPQWLGGFLENTKRHILISETLFDTIYEDRTESHVVY